MSNASGGAARQDLGACVLRASELACFQNDGAQRNASRLLLLLRNPGLLRSCTLRTTEFAGSGGIVLHVPWRKGLTSRSLHSLARVVNRLHIRYEVTVIGCYG
ncbi:unnamed protein product [Sphagnum jensenii]|uniref:Uncharacterized protein n=1 Tax=Sphagnum jensenii TaxID=128206 RepID=A0ABP0WZG2_9BRYO